MAQNNSEVKRDTRKQADRIDELMGILQTDMMFSPTKKQLIRMIQNRLRELKGVKRRPLGCPLVGLTYIADDNTLFIDVNRGHCTDMGGAVALAMSIAPTIEDIFVIEQASDVAVSHYTLRDGEWVSLMTGGAA